MTFIFVGAALFGLQMQGMYVRKILVGIEIVLGWWCSDWLLATNHPI